MVLIKPCTDLNSPGNAQLTSNKTCKLDATVVHVCMIDRCELLFLYFGFKTIIINPY